MNCGFSRESWVEFLYEETPPEEASRLRAHLEACPECRRIHDGMRRGREALDRIPVEKVESNVLEVFRRIALKSESRKRQWRFVAMASAAALLLSLAFLWASGWALQWDEGSFRLVRDANTDTAPAPVLSQKSAVVTEPVARGSTVELEGRLVPLERRLGSLERLVRLLASEVESNDREIRSDLSLTAAEVERMKKEGELLWRLTRQDVDQLYVAHLNHNNDRNESGD